MKGSDSNMADDQHFLIAAVESVESAITNAEAAAAKRHEQLISKLGEVISEIQNVSSTIITWSPDSD